MIRNMSLNTFLNTLRSISIINDVLPEPVEPLNKVVDGVEKHVSIAGYLVNFLSIKSSTFICTLSNIGLSCLMICIIY